MPSREAPELPSAEDMFLMFRRWMSQTMETMDQAQATPPERRQFIDTYGGREGFQNWLENIFRPTIEEMQQRGDTGQTSVGNDWMDLDDGEEEDANGYTYPDPLSRPPPGFTLPREGREVDEHNERKGYIPEVAEQFERRYASAGHTTPEEVQTKTRKQAEIIFAHWQDLQAIVERHEATIQKRWVKRTKAKRREALLKAWPQMPKCHRPDLQELFTLPVESRHKDYCMWPTINLEDLEQTEPLLLMINARGRNHPSVFAMGDLDHTNFGEETAVLDAPLRLNTHCMVFADKIGLASSKDNYGRLLCLKDDATAQELYTQGMGVSVGYGLRLFDVQVRLYEFLVAITKEILHGLSPEQLVGPNVPVQPEPPMISESRSKEITSWATASLEAAYRLPANMDVTHLKTVVAAKLSEAEDHLLGLREDPGYFEAHLADWAEHRQEKIRDPRNQLHPYLTENGLKIHFWQRVISSSVLDAMQNVEIWGDIYDKVEHLETLRREKYQVLDPAEKLPEELAKAFHLLYIAVVAYLEGPKKRLKNGWNASPPMRPYWGRIPPPRPIPKVIGTVPLGVDDPHSPVGIYIKVIDSLFKFGELPFDVLQPLMEYIERASKVEETKDFLTSWVCTHVFNLGLMSDIGSQIDRFWPWSCGFQKDRENHADELEDEFNATFKILLPLLQYEIPIHTVRLGVPDDGRFKYPAERARNKANVDQMRSAEAGLDTFFDSVRVDLIAAKAFPARTRALYERQVQRTPEFVEVPKHKKQKGNNGTPVNIPNENYRGEILDEAGPSFTPAKEKSKVKTRKTPEQDTPMQDVSSDSTTSDEDETLQVFKVDKRALKVFNYLFYTPSMSSLPGEVSWANFLHAMLSIGFSIEKQYGSVWRFTPTKIASERAILFHEPHPNPNIPLYIARRMGRRLHRAYRLSRESFELSE